MAAKVLSLPMGPYMSTEEVFEVASTLLHASGHSTPPASRPADSLTA